MSLSGCGQNVRIICIGKDAYSKYCANKCPFLIKVQWAPKEGVKYHVIEVTCCAEGGKAHSPKIARYEKVCPNGLGWDYIKGQKFEFDSARLDRKEKEFKPKPLIEPEVKVLERKQIKVTTKMKREQKVRNDEGQRTL